MQLIKIIIENFINNERKVLDLDTSGYILYSDDCFNDWIEFEKNTIWYIKLVKKLILNSIDFLGDREIWIDGKCIQIPYSIESQLGSEPSIELWFQEDQIKYKYIISFLDSSIYFESLSVFNGDIVYYRILNEGITLNSKYITKTEKEFIKVLDHFGGKSVLDSFEFGKKFSEILDGITILEDQPSTSDQFVRFLENFDVRYKYNSIEALNTVVKALGYTRFNRNGTLTIENNRFSADIGFESIGSGIQWLSYLFPYLLLSKNKGNIIVCYNLDRSLDMFMSKFLYDKFIKNNEVQLITRIGSLNKNGEFYSRF